MSQMMGGGSELVGPMPGVEGPRPSPDMVGPMPEVEGPRPAIADNLGKMQKFAEFLGDTPEEREKNAKAFAAMVKDVGAIGRSMSESSLMQRMMKESMGGSAVMTGGGAPAGGIAAIPRTFEPGAAQGIMAQLGFK